MNGDGLMDLVSTSRLNEPFQLNYWENTGAPFRPLVTDTRWIRHPIAEIADYDVVAETVDLDRDGDSDIVTINPCCAAGDTLRLWRNNTGAVSKQVSPTAVTGMAQGSQQAILRVVVSHLGKWADHAAEPAWWRLSLLDESGAPLTANQAQALFERFSVHTDTSGDGDWQAAPADTPVASTEVNTATVSAGGQITLTFAPGQPQAAVSPTGQITLFIAAKLRPVITGFNAFRVSFAPDADSVARDRVNQASTAILDTDPVTAAIVIQLPLTGDLIAVNDGPTVLGAATAFTATQLSGTVPVYVWGFGDGATAGGITGSHAYVSVGTYTAVVTASNLVSLITATTAVSVDIPLAGLSAGAAGPTQLGAATAFTSALAAGSRAVVQWAFGDGAFGAGASPTHTYAAIGTYSGVVTALNSLGTITSAVTATVIDVPVAGLVAASDSPAVIGDATTFTATTAGGTNVVYAWSFGDGVYAVGPGAQHTYGAVGVYTAVATASNSINAITAAVSVAVVPGAPATLTLEAAPAVQAAGESVTVTAVISDRFGNRVADGTLVTFSASLGAVDTPAVTLRGVATTALRSTLAATGLVTGVSGLASGSAVVTYTPGAPIITVTTSSSALAASSSSAVVVSVTDRYANPWRGMPLSARLDPPALGAVSGISQTDKLGLARGQWVAGRKPGAGSLIIGNGVLTASVPISVFNRTYLPVVVYRPGVWRVRVPLVNAP
jgi:PKD repeat protein